MRATKIATAVAALAMTGGALVSGTAAHAAAPVKCDNDDVTASYRARDAGAGHQYGLIRLTNTSDHACTIRGYGGLSYVGHGDGTQIGAAADRDAGRKRTVVLQPGDRAVSRIDEVNALNYPRRRCHPTPVDGFRVFIPDETRSQFVPHVTTGCARAGVHLIGHRPYRRA